MNKDTSSDKFFSSNDWANEKLRWFLREILYAETWVKHPQNKVILARILIERLESECFWWQAERLRNHLHRWMKHACTAEGRDTLSIKREREASL